MRRLANWIAALAFIPLVVGTTACEIKGFTILIPDYDQAEVLGVRIWEEDPQTGEFFEAVAITFDETVEDVNAGEVLMYGYAIDGEPLPVQVPALVNRNAADPSLVTLRFSLMPVYGHGIYRVSTYNDFGDSPLAEGAFTL